MGQRVAYGTIAISTLLSLFLFDMAIAELAVDLAGPLGRLVRRGSVLPLTFFVVLLLGAREMNQLLRLNGAKPFARFAYFMIFVLLASPWLSAAGWLGSGAADVEGFFWQLVWLMIAGVGVCALAVARRTPEGALRDISATLLMIVYLGFLASFGLLLRCGRDTPNQEGVWLLLIVVLTTKASDIGAYFVGSTLGRHKLLPAISPSKSVEGTVAGLAASGVVAALFVVLGGLVGGLQFDVGGGQVADRSPSLAMLIADMTRAISINHAGDIFSPITRAVILGLCLSAAGQLGDLVESCFKRDADVKDSGNVMPRFGGILDLVDSPVLAMPVAWFLLTAVWHVV